MKVISFFLLTFALVGVAAENGMPVLDKKPDTYCNPRFGYCFTYDAAIFNKIPPDINADGITISDSTGTIFLDVYGSFNPYKLGVQDLLDENLAYLLRNESSGPKTIREFKDEKSYIISFETDESYFKQELELEQYYYKVLTVKVPKSKKAIHQHIMETSHFEDNAAMVVR